MPVDIIIPSPGESIIEVILGPWQKSSGDWVERDETLVEIESDKVTLEVPASAAGVLNITAEEGAEMNVGDVIGAIDSDADRPAGTPATTDAATPDATEAAQVEVATATASAAGGTAAATTPPRATPLAKKVAADHGVPLGGVHGTGPSGRITKSDVLNAAPGSAPEAPSDASLATVAQPVITVPAGPRGIRRERMSKLRQRVAERLVQAQQTAAMLTTFNEADMTEIMRLRGEHKEAFKERHGVGLGFMSFFVSACVSALKVHQGINAYIDGNEVEYHDYVDISVAVGTPRGLVVPILRNAHMLSFAEIEAGIKDLALRARDGKLTMDDMTGGTFTISNGGVYGSLLSTPILNPPQSGILGMHNIVKRPVEDPDNPGQLALRPMMNLALSYDHRIVDGEQAVRFLVHVKQRLEQPERMLIGV
ncbi:MAG: 2-oxoglutarate dehydrogenase complex dihydrolipoyllysine-residue succinyltransferase [Planctomycetes bacterium]|nr:2-oxoglutarate dehydrogenase complex dihydrolipoyllysine-residue succinyltransferase [Planctomycetota bacterium]